MALQWFLRMASTNIVGHHSDACPKDAKAEHGKISVASCPEVGSQKSMAISEKDGWSGFRMPLHYPRYRKEDYEKMEMWKVDALLREYGLSCDGSVEERREFAMGAFLWPDQL